MVSCMSKYTQAPLHFFYSRYYVSIRFGIRVSRIKVCFSSFISDIPYYHHSLLVILHALEFVDSLGMGCLSLFYTCLLSGFHHFAWNGSSERSLAQRGSYLQFSCFAFLIHWAGLLLLGFGVRTCYL